MPVTYCDVFAFLWRSLQAMGCFFDCFRIHSDQPRRRHHLVLSSSPSTSTEEVPQKIRLSSLFTAQDQEECTVTKREGLVQRVERSGIEEGLLKEAKFLKACGTLSETPAEIRKAVTFTENVDESDIKGSHSMLNFSPDTPDKNQQTEMLPEIVERSDSCVPSRTLDSAPDTPEDIQKGETSAVNLEKSDARIPRTVIKSSPYPTPRKVTEDMQTPGTVFATNMTNLAKGNVRIRSQYVYTVSNPVQNNSQQQELREENSVLHDATDHEGECHSEHGNATPYSAVASCGEPNKKNIGDVSLSSWLKPPPANNGAAGQNLGVTTCRRPNFGRILGDRPIIGLVATHWNEQEEASRVTPKWWDGNGIPNSTTKYKEDQKVHWHATPFEERLEKALSEESSISQKQLITGKPLVFEEAEGHDTATSRLQSVNCPKSVVSF